ncbi:MAG: hypothetical protein ACE5PT_11170 [Gemmatimonadales bacterium]
MATLEACVLPVHVRVMHARGKNVYGGLRDYLEVRTLERYSRRLPTSDATHP